MLKKKTEFSPFDVATAGELRPALPRSAVVAAPCQACSVRHLSLCAVLDQDELSDLSAISTFKSLDSGDPLIDEGEDAIKVFNVTSGTLKIYKLMPDGRRQVTGFLFAGDFVGLAHQDTYAYSAEAVTQTTLCQFARTKLAVVLQRYPHLEHRLLSMASHELASAQDQMLLLGRKTAKEKVASFLILMSDRMKNRGLKGNPVSVPMSRTDIGDYLGLTTETVSRTFTQFKQKGIIRLLAGGDVELCDQDHLEGLAQGY